jgi:gamma-tubulin complex component 2
LQSPRRPIVYSERERDYEVLVREAHEAASQAVLHVLLNDYQLLGRLHSVKRYFLMEQGDVVVHFLDAAGGMSIEEIGSHLVSTAM